MDNKYKVLIVVGLLVVSFGAGKFSNPAKVKTEIKEVIKTVTVKEEAKAKIVYKEKIVYKDGTTREIEQTDESSNTRESSDSETNRSNVTIVTRDNGLTLQALAVFDTNNLKDREYGLYAKKRVFANISVGGFATTDKKIGIAVGLDF